LTSNIEYDDIMIGFFSIQQIVDRVKSVALWSAKKKEKKRTIKGYGSAAIVQNFVWEP
jgi:hypothetical protein